MASDWTKKSEKFARDRARILQVLNNAEMALDMAQIFSEFKMTYRYLPSIERRIRELVEEGLVVRIPAEIPRYKLPHKIPERRR